MEGGGGGIWTEGGREGGREGGGRGEGERGRRGVALDWRFMVKGRGENRRACRGTRVDVACCVAVCLLFVYSSFDGYDLLLFFFRFPASPHRCYLSSHSFFFSDPLTPSV